MSTILVNVLKPQSGTDLQVTGNLDVSGTISSYKFKTIVREDTNYQGSNTFGNSGADTHKFTGHVSGSGRAAFW